MNIILDFILHVDKYIGAIVQTYGAATYFLLFLVIFAETGFVIIPFLPGDSLIFVAGTFAAQSYLNIGILFVVLCLAAILGDSVNYWLGNYFGERVFSKIKFFSLERLEKTKNFYKKHGGKTIILARFVPIIRTFAPFVAGVGKMNYWQFISYNIIGGIAWVSLFLFGGYFFGGIPFVENNLTLVIFAIILISLIPPIVEWLRSRTKS